MFIENQKEPLAEYRDKSPLAIQYFGFASYDNAPNKYFYNCEGGLFFLIFFFARIDWTLGLSGENAYGEADIKELCRTYEALENEYNDFFPISEVTGIRPDGYIINFPLFIQAEKDAHVLLTTRAVSDRSDDCYEICKRIHLWIETFANNFPRFSTVIGGWGNSKIIIRRKQEDNVLRSAQYYDALDPDKQIIYLIQITTRKSEFTSRISNELHF